MTKTNFKDYIHNVNDFPKKGVLFRDISPLLANPKALKQVVKKLTKEAKGADVIVGADARGFIFGIIVAMKLNIPFVMARKAGKLPGKVIEQKYDLEYGNNTIEIQENAIKPNQKVVIIDDVLATGGTLKAIANLIKKMQGQVTKIVVVVELLPLKGINKLDGFNTISLVKY